MQSSHNDILTIDEILELAKKLTNIETKELLIKYIKTKVQPLNDETVYLDEKEQSFLSFREIQTKVLESINKQDGMSPMDLIYHPMKQ